MNIVIGSLIVAFLWSVGSISQKYILGTLTPTTTLVVTGILYGITMLVYFLFHKKTVLKDIQKIDFKVASVFTVFIILGIVASQLIFYSLAKEHDIYKVTALTFVSPIFTLLLATMLLGEKPTPLHILGILFVVVGVILVGGTK